MFCHRLVFFSYTGTIKFSTHIWKGVNHRGFGNLFVLLCHARVSLSDTPFKNGIVIGNDEIHLRYTCKCHILVNH